MEKPVQFTNKDGQRLHGILHIPENGLRYGKNEIVIIPEQIGYGRQYVYYARNLCDKGFYVLRFDPHGLGDSEGDIPGSSMPSFWGNVQTGLFVNDIMSAIDFITREEKIRRIILMGVCGDAVSSILTAGKDERIDALVLFGMPILMDDPLIDYQNDISSLHYRSYLVRYLYKVASFEDWKRLLSLKADYRRVFRLLGLWFAKEIKQKKASDIEKLLVNASPDFNRYILLSFVSLARRGGRILFIYGENEQNIKKFQSEFQSVYLDNKYDDVYEVYTIEDANHMLSRKKWQDIAMKKVIEWLQ